MTIWDDLFTSYRRYKWMDVDSPQYEPLENEVMSKDEIKKLKAKEYNEKNKDKNKIKRLEKLVAELRERNKELEKANIQDEPQLQKVLDYDRENELTDKIHKLQMANTQKEIEFAEFRNAVKVIMKYI